MKTTNPANLTHRYFTASEAPADTFTGARQAGWYFWQPAWAEWIHVGNCEGDDRRARIEGEMASGGAVSR